MPRSLSFSEYQIEARKTAVYSRDDFMNEGFIYTALGLNGEAGEVAEHAKKMIRDDDCLLSDDRIQALKKELGYVLWYLSNTCDEIGCTLEEVALLNIEKLRKRMESGKIHGSGSNR